MTSLVIDIIVIAVVVINAFIGAHKGFLYTVVRILGALTALVLAALVARPLGEFLYDVFLSSHMEEIVGDALRSVSGEQDFLTAINQMIADIPSFLSNSLGVDNIIAMLNSSAGIFDVDSMTQTIVNSAVKPIAVTIVGTLVFVVLFIAIFFATKVVAEVTRVANNIILVGELNKTLGGVTGMLYGLFLMFCVGALLWLVVILSGDTLGFVTQAEVEGSMLYRLYAFLSGLSFEINIERYAEGLINGLLSVGR